MDLYQVVVTEDGKFYPQIRERVRGTLGIYTRHYYRNLGVESHLSYQSAWKLIMDYDCGRI